LGNKNKFIIIVFLLLFPINLFAGGTQEDRLDIAERLITEQRYDEAQRILADIMREEPEKFGAAQKLQEIINEQRNSFNYKAKELIGVLYEEKDVEKALEIIEELEQIDPNPSVEVKEFLDDSYRSALIVANKNRFDNIMERALVQLKSDEHYEAILTYLTGFDLHKEEFDEADYGTIVKNAINNSLSRLLELTDTVNSMKEEINTANTNVIKVMLEDDLNLLFAGLDDYLTIVSRVQSIRNEIKGIRDIFTAQNEQLKANPEDQIGDYFLFYAYNLLGGRANINEKEGIENAVLFLIEGNYLELTAYLEEKAALYFASSKGDYDVDNFSGAANNIEVSADYYRALQQITYQKETSEELSADYDVSDVEKLIFGPELLDFMKYQLKALECFYSNTLIDEMVNITSLKGKAEVNSRSELFGPEVNIFAQTDSLDLVAAQWNDFILYMNNFYKINELLAYDNLNNKSITDITDQVNNIKDNMLPELSGGIVKYLSEYERLFSLLFDSIEPEFNRERVLLLNGENITVLDGNITRTVRYPDRRLSALQELKEDLAYLKESFTKIIDRWPLDEDYLTKVNEIDTIIRSIEVMLNNIDDIDEDIDIQVLIANENIITAERFKNEGMTSYRAAQNAKDSNRFLDAKEYLANAISSFDRSLEKQEDEEVRNLRDNVFPELIAEINAAENAYVVIEVRELIDDGIQAFRENRFDDSEKILIQAQTRWLDTHVEDDQEIVSWLTLVQRARNLVSGFELLETEPGYAEITQRLNYATEDYLNGLEFKEQGNIAQANAVFESAIEKLNNVKISHPLLKEANILYLKIQKELDPNSFERNFNNQKQAAQNALRTNNDLQMRNMYSILKDYELVIPDDREMQNLIYDLEIKLRLRIPLPSTQDIAESTSKYNDANDIYVETIRDQYARAIELLSEAIVLWPKNSDAIALKNRMDFDSGNLRQDFLSADDSIQFSRAERLFNERSYVESRTIVESLWNRANNKNYPPLIDLRNQLITRLGL
jgi:tetratricopeptide (TPR) repeat protein